MTEMQKDVITFSVTATREVEQDFITVTFQANETGTDPNEVQHELSERLKEAFLKARPEVVPGELDVKSGNFQVGPRYGKKNEIVGYNGIVELVIYGTDTKAIASLTSEIKSMNIAGFDHSVSPKLRKTVEEELALEAIALWLEKGDAYSAAFNATGFDVGTTNIQVSSGYNSYRRTGGARMMSASMSLESPMGGSAFEEQAGKEEVTATVSGNAKLVR